jgi:adenylate cyclase
MGPEDFKRKLTAVFSADVAGYSRLMGEDEAATVRTLATYREVMTALIKQHRGRVVDSPGDNLLAEFASVVDAVQCAVAVQKEFQARNAELAESRRMEFRIGINLGDVIEEENRIYGDGVNIAARLEALADPGGICISKTAFDQIETKLPLGYEYLGEQSVKNIAKPVGAYRVLMEPRVIVAQLKQKEQAAPVWRRKSNMAGVIVAALMVIAALIWNFYFRAPPIEPASAEKMAFPLPEKPSIAVLPFTNMSGDPEQEYFSDGLTEEIITALSKTPKMFVIARNSTFSYKGQQVKIQQVAEELGVRYVLEGSVRKSEDRVRVTAQLIDAITGRHLWAERYDKDLKDIFALQDQITLKILNALQVKLTEGEAFSGAAKGTNNLEAYLKWLLSREYTGKYTKEGLAMGRKLAEEAIALDCDFPFPYLSVSATHIIDSMFGWSESPEQSLKLAEEMVQKALTLDDSLGMGHSFLGRIHLTKRQYNKAISEGERAILLAPNSDFAHAALAYTLHRVGRQEEAIRFYKKAIRLNPHAPEWYFSGLGSCYRMMGQYEEAVREHKRNLLKTPTRLGDHIALAATYILMGREEDARTEAEEVLRLHPKFSVKHFAEQQMYKDQADTDRFVAALRKAGLPEHPQLPLPDKPSIAVLPFVNMSDDKSQEYFSDGLTEEIITALSKTPKLFVIARNSSFVYKGKAVDVKQVGRELGVKYVLEGSVRRSGDQLRITAQLIDATTGNHLWAERYDREMKDVFAIQDEITMKIVRSFINLTESQLWQLSLAGKHPSNLQAYLKLLEGIGYSYQSKFSDAMKSFEEALSLDPQFPSTYVWIAWEHMFNVWFGPSATRRQSLEKAFQFAQKAKELDDKSPGAYATLGHAYLLKRDYEKALSEGRRATQLEPNSGVMASHFGWTLRSVRRYDEAIKEYERAIRLDPFNPYPISQLGATYLMMKRYEESISACRKALELNPRMLSAYIALTMAYSSLDKMKEATEAASEVLRLSPNFSVEHFAKALPYKYEEDRVFMIDALRKAGLK